MPHTIAENLTRLQNDVTASRTAIINKGGVFGLTNGLDDFADAINSIPGPDTPQNVKLVDYDGTILHTYSKAQFAALESLPAYPTHEGLRGLTWNWSLANAKSYLNTYDDLIIGMLYTINDTSKELNLIGVAEIHKWHGFDRLVRGLADYYSKPQNYIVRFHVVGYFFSVEIENEFKKIVSDNHMEDYVILYGKKHGEELDMLFNKCDFGIGSLGRHRVGIDKIKTLKNREYAARGIPFIYSETDSDFDTKPYVVKAPADETAIDINSIVEFYKNISMSPKEIRNSILDLSWENQMKTVLSNI